ncbi:hypothetical protein CGRA01v4_02178 [Colletotrichum graminicola]|nr:hypothetical protein CGRA01v4_02178 [Colletotrichum graminicola]
MSRSWDPRGRKSIDPGRGSEAGFKENKRKRRKKTRPSQSGSARREGMRCCCPSEMLLPLRD